MQGPGGVSDKSRVALGYFLLSLPLFTLPAGAPSSGGPQWVTLLQEPLLEASVMLEDNNQLKR